MKITSLLFSYFIGIIITPMYCNCQVDDHFTMVYARDKKVYSRDFGHHSTPKELKEFNGTVLDLVNYNDQLYVLIKHELEYNAIWRGNKLINDSTSFGIDNTSWEEFHVVRINGDGDDATYLRSMVIVNGDIYSGRTDGVIWKCSVDKARSCDKEMFKKYINSYNEGEIVYDPNDNQLYTVWLNVLWHCSTDNHQVNSKAEIELDDMTTLHVAFDAVWIGDAGRIRKCLLNQENSSINDLDCTEFHDLKVGVVKIKFGSSSKYLYVHLDKYIWRCNPNATDSCRQQFRPLHADQMGPFIIL